jgi:hypothetical protein
MHNPHDHSAAEPAIDARHDRRGPHRLARDRRAVCLVRDRPPTAEPQVGASSLNAFRPRFVLLGLGLGKVDSLESSMGLMKIHEPPQAAPAAAAPGAGPP